jgi:hypothetical protein
VDLISPERAEYNVLKVYFDGTAVASFVGGTPGATPFNYLQIYAADFLYAATHVHAPEQVVESGAASVSISAQDLLNRCETEAVGDRRAGLVVARVIRDA